MSEGVRGGLTLPWLWVAVLIAFLALGFMLPPLDKPLRELSKGKPQAGQQTEQKSDGGGNKEEIVF